MLARSFRGQWPCQWVPSRRGLCLLLGPVTRCVASNPGLEVLGALLRRRGPGRAPNENASNFPRSSWGIGRPSLLDPPCGPCPSLSSAHLLLLVSDVDYGHCVRRRGGKSSPVCVPRNFKYISRSLVESANQNTSFD